MQLSCPNCSQGRAATRPPTGGKGIRTLSTTSGWRTSVTNGRNYTRNYTFTSRGEVYTLTMPDSSVETWSYNGTGQVSAYTNPLSQTINYSFDDASRQTGITYPTGANPTFTYDSAGRRTQMTDSTGTTSWTLDNANQVTQLVTPQGTISYTYDNAGRRATMVETGVGTTTYSYDNASRLTSIANPFSETTSRSYDADNRLTTQTFSTGATANFGYDSRSRMTSVTHKKSDGTTVLDGETYVYDSAGNLSSKTVNSTTTSYTYDSADQLLTEAFTGYSASYTYDANGNRASKTLNGVTDTYTNDNSDKLTSIALGAGGTKSYTYDTAGRCTSVTVGGGTTSLAYDYENRVTGITYPSTATNSFTYNALDTRVGKVDSGGTFTYKRDGVNVTDPVINDAAASYTPGVSERRSGASKFYHGERQGSNVLETNSSQTATATKTYDAFGMLISSSGSSSSPFGYVGQQGYQSDGDSGLMLLGHRYYDSSTGRFLTRDRAKDGRNWYSYCRNNPVRSIDPTGNWDWAAVLIGTLEDVIGGIVQVPLPEIVDFVYHFKEAWELRDVRTDMKNGKPPPPQLGHGNDGSVLQDTLHKMYMENPVQSDRRRQLSPPERGENASW